MELKGKIIDFLGDSITEGVGVTDQNNRYDNVIHRRFELAAHYNYGIGGTRLAHQSVPSEIPRYDLCFCGRAYMLDKSADLIVVYGGVNDYIHGDAYFGNMEDRTPTTFCGAVYFLMNLLKTNYEGKKIVFMTPAHMHFKGISDKFPTGRPMKKPDAQPLSAYVEVIKARGEELGIPVLDLFEKLPIDPNNESDREKYTVDGLHFNDEGQGILAKTLGDFLETL
jgi:lysophospholipase L1-like esterase